ncbi:MAG: diadenylate cyclase [Deltaproteobacteria bacterium]|nr:diadenylate cyclase [Deltaproteobacteria bacterium]
MTNFPIIANLRIQDVLDIVFLTIVTYHLYLWFRGTKAFKALVGLLVLGVVFTLARTWGLFLTTWVFQIFWQVLVILLIILFQSEIRQVLERFNPLRTLGLRRHSLAGRWLRGFPEAAFRLAERRTGALMIVERSDRVEEWITGGRELDGEPDADILLSIFQKESPLHDGAVLIREGRITRVACYLPLSSAEGLPREWGTRHRAAMGIAERCDALVVVVSEERGEVSFAREGKMHPVDTPERLHRLLLESVTHLGPAKETQWKRAKSLFLRRWPVKLGTLFLVSLLWLLLAGQQDFEVALTVPLEAKNLPAGMEILEPISPEVRIRVRGLRKDASSLSENNVRAQIDLSLANTGKKTFPVTRDQIQLPTERVYVVGIEPSQIPFRFKHKQQSND